MLQLSDGNWTISSPDGNITAEIQLHEKELFYAVSDSQGELMKKSPAGIKTSAADFFCDLSFLEESRRIIDETYSMTGGKKRVHRNDAAELNLRFAVGEEILNFVVRAYNDGVAYRYALDGEGPVSVFSEKSAFAVPESAEGWAMDFINHYEGFYEHRDVSGLMKGTFGMPLLIRNGDRYTLISEAAVYGGYCASHLVGCESEGLLKLKFAPDEGPSVVGCRPFATPWRVMAAGSLADIVATEIFENLNPPREIADTSWIKPGRSAWSWWSGDSTDDYEVQKKYVDFAGRMGWEYYLCDAGWQKSWITDLVQYANERKVDILVWYHYRSLETDEQQQSNLPWLASIGVKGIKVDFFESDSQERIRLYDKIAQIAGKYKLMVVYHGCTKPSGERRKWPHIMTREGILGAEYYKIAEGPTARHNCTVPFTRNVVGPMDYTPVTFSNEKLNTTWAHQMALAMVFESSIQHFADTPEAYNRLGEALNFLRVCPAQWDDIRLLEGEPGRFITLARKKGEDWFIGALCGDETEHVVRIEISSFGQSDCEAEIYSDGSSPQEIHSEKKLLHPGDVLQIPMQKSGGCCLRLSFHA